MLPKNYLVFKWIVYAIASLFLCALQSLVLSHIRVLGLTPFLFPMLPAMAAMFEGAKHGGVFGLVLGLMCDLLLPAPFPGFFTIAFSAGAILAGVFAERLASRGMACALIVSALGLLVTCALRLLVQILLGGQHLALMARIALGETLLTLPVVVVVLPLYRTIAKRCSADY